MLKNEKGFSLVEVLVVAGMMSIMMLAFMAMQDAQMKSNNYLEFQLKKTQLQNALLGQVLNDPNNCACLFAGANPFPASPAAPGATLAGVAPTQIGRYNFVTPGVCGTATVPQPLVNSVGIDGIKATSIQLTKIRNVSGVYLGELLVNIQSTKSVAGPQDLQIPIPVNITASPAGANMNFVSCSLNSGTISYKAFLGAPVSLPLGAMPAGTTTAHDFLADIPASDQPNVVAIQISIGNQTHTIATWNVSTQVTIEIDGATVYDFFSDTATDNEHFILTQNVFVAPGLRNINAAQARMLNNPQFQARVIGYLMRQ